MTLLYALIYSGVFERFPNLTLLFAEVGTGWLPYLFREIDDRVSSTAELFPGQWKLPAPARRERSYGGSMADVYKRMGDPLVAS